MGCARGGARLVGESRANATMPSTVATVPWVEKYRPKTLSDVAAHKDIVDTVTRLVDEKKLPHLLLYGPPGTGKTSMILAVARQIYGAAATQMTLHLNASDERGIDVVRNDVQGFASTRQIFSKGFKLIILDECDAMTNDAQFALRRIMEKYTKNTRFCLICNYVSKVIPALQSRCTRFRFSPLPDAYVTERVQHIVEEEHVSVEGRGVDALVKLAKGDMRRALNLLQSTSMASNGVVSEDAVYACTGQPKPDRVKAILDVLLNAPFHACVAHLEQCRSEGLALVDILQDLGSLVLTLHLPQGVCGDLLASLADLEHALSGAVSERLQLGALVGTFIEARQAIVNAAV